MGRSTKDGKRNLKISFVLFFLLLFCTTASATVYLKDDFEAPTYSEGNLSGQNDWYNLNTTHIAIVGGQYVRGWGTGDYSFLYTTKVFTTATDDIIELGFNISFDGRMPAYNHIAFFDTDASYYATYLSCESDGDLVHFYNDTAFDLLVTDGCLETNWHRVVIQFNNSGSKYDIYYDDVIKEDDAPYSPSAVGGNFTIVSLIATGGTNMSYYLDDVCVANNDSECVFSDTTPNITLSSPANGTNYAFNTTVVYLNVSYFDNDLDNGTVVFFADLVDATTRVNISNILTNGSSAVHILNVIENSTVHWKGCVNNTIHPDLVCPSEWVFSVNATPSVINTPSNVVLLEGTLNDGDVVSLQGNDSDIYNISEVVGSPAFNITFNITKFNTVDRVLFDYYYEGNPAHVINVYFYNGSVWNVVGTLDDGAGFVSEYFSLGDEYNVSGVVMGMVAHVSAGVTSHVLNLDLIELFDNPPPDSNISGIAVGLPSSCTIFTLFELNGSFDCVSNDQSFNCSGVYNWSVPDACSLDSGVLDGVFDVENGSSFVSWLNVSCPSASVNYSFYFNGTNVGDAELSASDVIACLGAGGGLTADEHYCLLYGYLSDGVTKCMLGRIYDLLYWLSGFGRLFVGEVHDTGGVVLG